MPTLESYDPLVQALEDAADGAHYQFVVLLDKLAAGTVVLLTVSARNTAGESPAGDAVEIAVP